MKRDHCQHGERYANECLNQVIASAGARFVFFGVHGAMACCEMDFRFRQQRRGQRREGRYVDPILGWATLAVRHAATIAGFRSSL
jgi:hypothetical protein